MSSSPTREEEEEEDDDDDELIVPDQYVVPKIFLCMLATAKTVPNQRGPDGARVFHFANIAHSPRFQRVWIQGVVVHSGTLGGGGTSLVIDDSTGYPIEVYVPPSSRTYYSMRVVDPSEATGHPTVGSYVACMGSLTPNPPSEVTTAGDGGRGGAKITRANLGLRAERLHDLSGEEDVQREAMWNAEVIDALKILEFAHHSRNGWRCPNFTA